MFIAQATCGVTSARVAALRSSCSLQRYREWWQAALNEAERSVSILRFAISVV